MADQSVIVAQPQKGPQTNFVTCPVFEIFYGGARGGGKTMAVLLKWAVHAAENGSKARGLILRRELTNLRDMIATAHSIYGPIGAKWREQAKEYVMPNGAVLVFAYLDNDRDADAYQGHNYSFVGIEEITQFPDPAPINKLRATLRVPGIKRHFVATGNPGGVGHHWVKARYIDPAPKGYEIIREDIDGIIMERVFIPAKVKDNLFLDATYVAQLKQSGSEQLVKAWLDGDWNIIEGSFFTEFGNQHIVEPFEIPSHWTRYRAFDWGSYRPYAGLWFAVSDGTVFGRAGDLIVYKELYGSTGVPNVGVKETADIVGAKIKQHDAGDKITFGVADPSIFKEDGGPSIAERMGYAGAYFVPADNTRIAGWNEVRRRLRGYDDKPSIYFFSTCVHTIRTIPILQHDKHKPEDVDTEGEDHLGDTLRYGCMARPMVTPAPEHKPDGILVKDLFRPRAVNRRI